MSISSQPTMSAGRATHGLGLALDTALVVRGRRLTIDACHLDGLVDVPAGTGVTDPSHRLVRFRRRRSRDDADGCSAS